MNSWKLDPIIVFKFSDEVLQLTYLEKNCQNKIKSQFTLAQYLTVRRKYKQQKNGDHIWRYTSLLIEKVF